MNFKLNFALTEVYQTVHMKELTDFPENDQEDPTEVFTDFHFWGRSVACFQVGAGARASGPGSLGLAPVVATASFPLINLPNFILASLS